MPSASELVSRVGCTATDVAVHCVTLQNKKLLRADQSFGSYSASASSRGEHDGQSRTTSLIEEITHDPRTAPLVQSRRSQGSVVGGLPTDRANPIILMRTMAASRCRFSLRLSQAVEAFIYLPAGRPLIVALQMAPQSVGARRPARRSAIQASVSLAESLARVAWPDQLIVR